MNFELKKLVLDSREVAKMLGKNHADLLRDVAKNVKYLTESKIAFSEFFKETQYKDSTGKKNKRYDITKKGCEFLAHKLTGKKGAIFTATYINEFHKMEQTLKKNITQEKLPFSSSVMIPIDKIEYWNKIKELSNEADDVRSEIYHKLNLLSNMVVSITREVDKLANIVFETEDNINKIEGRDMNLNSMLALNK